MAQRQAVPGQADEPNTILDGGFRLVAVLGVVMVLLMVVRLLADASGPAGGGDVPGAVAPGGAAGASPAVAGCRLDASIFGGRRLVPASRSSSQRRGSR